MVLTEPDLYWLAGLLEGEGSFFWQSRPDRPRNQLRVYLAMTDEDVVRRAATLMGVASVQRRTRRETHWQDQWVAVATGGRAESVMRAILPHMGERRSAKIAELLNPAPSEECQATP